jgi:hypothetical protein
VLDGDVTAKARAECSGNCRRERDLGDQHEHAAAAATDVIGQLQVDLGLAAPGYAVQ